MKSPSAAELYLRWLFRSEILHEGEAVEVEVVGLGPELYLSLATKDPIGGDQSTHELSYEGFSRQPARRGFGVSDWAVENGSATLVKPIHFGPRENAGATEYLFWTLGLAEEGPGTLLYSGPLFLDAASPCVIEKSGRVLCPRLEWKVGDRAMFQPIGDTPLPNGVSTSVAYHVVKVEGDGFFVSAKSGGDPGHPGVGSGLVGRAAPRIVAKEDEPQIRTGALRIFEE